MTEVITMRDIEKSAGMFFCHKMFCDDRQNETAMQMLMKYLTMISGGADMSEYEAMMWQVAEKHSQTMMKAISEVEDKAGISIPEGAAREFAIKQAAAMAALAELTTVVSGHTWETELKNISQVNKDNIDEELIKVTDGLSPDMLGAVAKVIVENSYPNEKPTLDILTALWIEGAMVAIMADDMCRFLKEMEPRLYERYVAQAKEKFIVIPD
jgi:hypothetical protein